MYFEYFGDVAGFELTKCLPPEGMGNTKWWKEQAGLRCVIESSRNIIFVAKCLFLHLQSLVFCDIIVI